MDTETTNITPRIYSREEHTVSRKNIDPDALKVMRHLMRNGYKAYLVGGAVRDLLLGKKPKDFDITTDATPRRIKSLFRNCRIIGRRFKLAHIFFGNEKIFEVSTFRASHDEITADELNSDEVEEKDFMLMDDNVYGDECSDALRRDITINALFYSLKNFSIIDYTGGMEDLRNGIIRVIGEPEVRFVEDPVRMLRVVRHAVRSGFKLDKACLKAINNRHHLIEQCSEARLYEEIRKDLVSGYAVEILQNYTQRGLLQHLLPEISSNEDSFLASKCLFANCLKRLDAFALKNGLDSTTEAFTLMAICLANPQADHITVADNFENKESIGEYVHNCFKRLSIPRKERERIADIMDIIRQLETGKFSLRKFSRKASFPTLLHVLSFADLDFGEDLSSIELERSTKQSKTNNKTSSRRQSARKQGNKNYTNRRSFRSKQS